MSFRSKSYAVAIFLFALGVVGILIGKPGIAIMSWPVALIPLLMATTAISDPDFQIRSTRSDTLAKQYRFENFVTGQPCRGGTVNAVWREVKG